MGKDWWRWVQAVFGVAIIGYAIRFLIQNWVTIKAAPLEWRIRIVPITGSLLLVLATYGLLVEAWRRVVNGWGAEIAWWPAARVWVLSSMGKYLPGKLWTIAGLGVLGKEQGVPALTATASAIGSPPSSPSSIPVPIGRSCLRGDSRTGSRGFRAGAIS